jgi:hypothetical protein
MHEFFLAFMAEAAHQTWVKGSNVAYFDLWYASSAYQGGSSPRAHRFWW